MTMRPTLILAALIAAAVAVLLALDLHDRRVCEERGQRIEAHDGAYHGSGDQPWIVTQYGCEPDAGAAGRRE